MDEGKARYLRVLAVALASSASCAMDYGEPPPTVAVAAAETEIGVAFGQSRTTRPVDAFLITRTPITVGQYRRCVDARRCTPPSLQDGVCSLPDPLPTQRATWDLGDALPLTCVTEQQAAEYCGYIGGTLPTPEQWLLAARGKSVQRFSSGPKPPTCEQHPGSAACPVSHDRPLEQFAAGTHPEGASPTGVEDILLTPFELVRADPRPERLVPGCGAPGSLCLVGSAVPAAIDRFQTTEHPTNKTFGFRCAWSDS